MGSSFGHVDDLGRCLLRVERPSGADDVLAILDTGFNGELMMSRSMAITLGVELLPGLVDAQFANETTALVQIGQMPIVWFKHMKTVEVLIVDDASTQSRGSRQPSALLGTALLRPHLLLIDFARTTIELEQNSGT
jgi:predicted aspartyl protease